MKATRYLIWIGFVALVLCSGLPRAQAVTYTVVIEGEEGANRLPLAIADFQPLEGGEGPADVSRKLPDKLRRLMEFTGLFVDVPRETFAEPNPLSGLVPGVEVDYEPWRLIGTDMLVKGGYRLSGSSLTLEIRLFDCVQGKMVLGKRYTGNRQDAKQMIFRFANALLLQLTGEPGVFGSAIVFSAGGGSNRAVLQTVFGADKEDVKGVAGGFSTQPAISNGGSIAYIHRQGQTTWQLRVGGQVISSGPMVLTPTFTADGALLAALSGRQATNIYRFPGPGARPVPVTNGWGINISPTVSPDGGQLAFVSDRGGSPTIYVSAMNGGGVRRLTDGRCMDPDWSPRGDRIAYSCGGDVFTCGPDGSDVQQLTHGQGDNTSPSWSPDGKLLVFSSTRGGRAQLYVMTANGERQLPMVPDYTGDMRNSRWSKGMPEEYGDQP